MSLDFSKEGIASRVASLPLLEKDVLQILELLDDPESNFDDIIARLSPEVSAKFLKMANSAVYGVKVSSISHALRVLGYDAMRQSLLTSLLLDHFDRAADRLDFNLEKFHQQAALCVVVARAIGQIIEFERPADLFTVAMLHNIGKLVIAAYFPGEHEAILSLKKTLELPTRAAEKRVLGCSHAEISGMVLKTFNIPEPLVRAVRFHEDSDRVVPAQEQYQLEILLREAARLVDSLQLPASLDPDQLMRQLEEAIADGRQEIRRLRQEEIKDKGFEEVFMLLLKRAGSLVEGAMAAIIAGRADRQQG